MSLLLHIECSTGLPGIDNGLRCLLHWWRKLRKEALGDGLGRRQYMCIVYIMYNVFDFRIDSYILLRNGRLGS